MPLLLRQVNCRKAKPTAIAGAVEFATQVAVWPLKADFVI
jgi:hypothetical protein